MGRETVEFETAESGIDWFEAAGSPASSSGAAAGFPPLEVEPARARYELLLTALAPLSHHDPAIQDDSNRLLFNRQRQVVGPLPAAALGDGERWAAEVCAAETLPEAVADLAAGLSLPEFVAAALLRRFLDAYNSLEGAGLFSGAERYQRLEARARLAAVAAASLRGWWNRLCDTMQVPVAGGEEDRALLRLLAAPTVLQQHVLRVLERDHHSSLLLARVWHQGVKAESAAYAERAGVAAGSGARVALAFAAGAAAEQPPARVVEVPAVSGNHLRHRVVREPAWLHLCRRLGLEAGWPGRGELAPGVEAIFYNGGNIRAGATQPSNPFGLAWQARELYPVLDLLGGVTDSFDLGSSRLRVAAWLVCRENAAALAGSPAAELPLARVSAFELLDEVTLTRQAGRVGSGQMLWSFETLCAGAQVLLRLDLQPYTPLLTQGALVAAVETYLGEDGTLGGQAARGFGAARGEWLAAPAGAERAALRRAYEQYLEERREALREGLRQGTLGTGRVLVS
jgi:hypothetical protein